MMTLQILRSVDFTKLQKPRYLENETFSLQIKKIINCIHKFIKGYFIAKNGFVAELTFKLNGYIRKIVIGLLNE